MAESFLNILSEEFRARNIKRPSYSFRAFSRDMGLSPSYLTLVMQGKRKLSLGRAYILAERLGWDERKTRVFVLQVQATQASSNFELKMIDHELKILQLTE